MPSSVKYIVTESPGPQGTDWSRTMRYRDPKVHPEIWEMLCMPRRKANQAPSISGKGLARYLLSGEKFPAPVDLYRYMEEEDYRCSYQTFSTSLAGVANENFQE